MLFQQDNNSGQLTINSYQPGALVINQETFASSVLITTAGEVSSNELPATFAELNQDHLDKLSREKPEVILIGTGPKQEAVSLALKKMIIEKGLAVDIMDTRAACRTFTIVSSEGRRAIAALFV